MQTKTKGLIFKRQENKFLDNLLAGEGIFRSENEIECEFNLVDDTNQLIGCCNSAHAKDLKSRRLTTRHAFYLG